uniref:CytochromeP450 n=1 Tax=Riptortus pedestris TaxID=329032 RepID=R4WD28_RIPPE|nr:cytochromeP450 [Riptortus pedestris]
MELFNELKYIERVIKETLRIYPSVPVIGREIAKDIDLPSGYKVPAGSIMAVIIAGIHFNKKHYPNPEVFDPDRFLPEKMVNRHPYSYVPFSAGPRNCIGQRFAMLELKSAISHFLLKYEIGAEGDTLPGMILTLQSDNGHKVWLRPRVNK